MKQIRQQAPVLLDATKMALVFLRGLDPLEDAQDEHNRQTTMRTLADAIDAAEPPTFDTASASIRLEMTHPSWTTLRRILADSRNEEDALVLRAAEEGVRETKQRVYLTLSINPRVLRRLHFVLLHKPPSAQQKAFERLAEQIQEDGLSKNPMEILAEMGL